MFVPEQGSLGGKWMARNILLLVVLAGVLFVGYKFWQTQQEKVRIESGDITCQGCLEGDAKARYEREDHGETADGGSEHKNETARQAAERAVAGTNGTAQGAYSGPGATSSSMVPPAENYDAQGVGAGQPPVQVPTAGQPGGVPMTDSQAANAPNGQRFAGSGAYLVYRQGNITYRLDTTTGRSCIIYATMEEWRKPIVMSNGCGRTS
jgi:hypothetical protein